MKHFNVLFFMALGSLQKCWTCVYDRGPFLILNRDKKYPLRNALVFQNEHR